MNFLNLEYFLVAAEELSFTRAAQKLYVSQQSLSKHIANLEEDFDIELFQRTQPLKLTYAGKCLEAKALKIMSLREEIRRELEDVKDYKRGKINIAISHTRGRAVLPRLLPAFVDKFPHIDVNLLEGSSKVMAQALYHGEVDLLIDILPFCENDIKAIPLCNDDVCMIIPDQVLKERFSKNFMEVRAELNGDNCFKILKDCPFLMLHKSNRVRMIADEMLEYYQIKPKVILETQNVETLLSLSLKGMGITFVSKMFLDEYNLIAQSENTKNYLIIVPNYVKCDATLAIGYKEERYLPRAAQEFIALAQETFKVKPFNRIGIPKT